MGEQELLASAQTQLFRASMDAKELTGPVLERGAGSLVWDITGKAYLDFNSGQMCSALGHNHPRVVAAIQEASQKLIHACSSLLNVNQIRLVQTLGATVPSLLPNSLVLLSGSDANEAAAGGGGITRGRAAQRKIAGQEDRSPGTEPAGRRRERLAMTLRDTDMQVLWLATVTYHLGLGIQQVVLGWVVLALTQSEAMVGAVFAVRAAPNLVVGFAVGTLTDRCDRRSLMRLAAFGMTGIALVVAWLAYTEQLTVWHLLLGTGALGMWQALEMTARQAFVVDTLGVHRAVQGIALVSLAQRFGGVLGALVAGVTLTWWGTAMAFLAMATCYSTGACVLYALRRQGVAAPAVREPIRQNLLTYLRALRTNQDMRTLMFSTAAAELFGFSHQVMLPILAKEVLQVGAGGLGVLTAFRFLGGVLGVSVLTGIGVMHRRGQMLLAALALFGAGQILLAYAPTFWFAAACVIFINIMAAATDVLHQTLLQFSVANEQRGRAMGSWIIGTGIGPVGHLEVGSLASLTSAHLALLVNGLALMMLTVGMAVCIPRLWRL